MKVGTILRGGINGSLYSCVAALVSRGEGQDVYVLTSSFLNGSSKIYDSSYRHHLADRVSPPVKFGKSTEVLATELVGYLKLRPNVDSSFGAVSNTNLVMPDSIKLATDNGIAYNNMQAGDLGSHLYMQISKTEYLRCEVTGYNAQCKVPRPNASGSMIISDAIRLSLPANCPFSEDFRPLAGRQILNDQGAFVGMSIAGAGQSVFVAILEGWLAERDFFVLPNIDASVNREDTVLHRFASEYLCSELNFLEVMNETRQLVSEYYWLISARYNIETVELIQDEFAYLLVERFGIEEIVDNLFGIKLLESTADTEYSDYWLFRSLSGRLELLEFISNKPELYVSCKKSFTRISNRELERKKSTFMNPEDAICNLIGRGKFTITDEDQFSANKT